MKVKMRQQISGTRNGADWPAPGGVLEVGDDEGASLCANRLAEPVAEPEKSVRKATARKPETRKKS